MTFLCALLAASLLALTAATNVEDCGSSATISNLIITGCDVPPCRFQRGTNITVDIDFKNNEATSKLTTKVTATLAGVDIPWTGTDPNGCDNLTEGGCPLEVGEESHYKASAPVLKSYPPVSVIVTWKLVADSGKSTVCFIVPVTVV